MLKDFFKRTRILDGGMGQHLLTKGLVAQGSLWSTTALIEKKYHQLVIDAHLDFIESGADVIVTNNFSARRTRMIENNVEELFEYANSKAGELAVKAKEISKKNILIAGSLPAQNKTYVLDDRNNKTIEKNFLDQAKPNEIVALIVLADGCDVLFFRTTQEVENRRNSFPVSEQIENQSPVPYSKYLSWRGLLDSQLPNRPSPTRPSSSAAMRRNDWKMGFVASKDATTGIVHMPPSRIGIKGGGIDDMEQLPMADSIGTIETFTVDNLVYSPNSPVVFAVVNFEDGGRLPVELTDTDPEKIEIGDRVEMTFRCLYTADGIHNYFWKARPVRREREKS